MPKRIVPEEDQSWQRPVLAISNNGTATKGNRYIVGESPSGEFSGFTTDNITWYDGDEWHQDTPEEGWIVYDINQSELLIYMNGPSGDYWYYFRDIFGSEGGPPGTVNAEDVIVDASGFSGNLSSSDSDLQTALETIDQMSAGSGLTHSQVLARSLGC